jgi:hypothetical protein
MVKAVEARASHGVQAAASEASIPLNRTHRGLRDVEIDRCEGKRERKARGYSRTHSSDGGKADVGISTNTVSADEDDDRPLKKPKAASSRPHAALKQYKFINWSTVKHDLAGYIAKLKAAPSASLDERTLMSQLDSDIQSLLSDLGHRMPTHQDLQRTQVHSTLRQLFKTYPENANSKLARSIWNSWKADFERQEQQKKAAEPAAAATDSESLALNSCVTAKDVLDYLKNPNSANPEYVVASIAVLGNASVATAAQLPVPLPCQSSDECRTGMKARLLSVFKEHMQRRLPADKVVVDPSRFEVVCEELERSVHEEYGGADDAYKRHFEVLLTHLSNKCGFTLHLLQGFIDPKTVSSASSLHDQFAEAQRSGMLCAQRLLARNPLPLLPELERTTSDEGLHASTEGHNKEQAAHSRILAALSDDEVSQMKSKGNEWIAGHVSSEGVVGWSLKDENFDYGL